MLLYAGVRATQPSVEACMAMCCIKCTACSHTVVCTLARISRAGLHTAVARLKPSSRSALQVLQFSTQSLSLLLLDMVTARKQNLALLGCFRKFTSNTPDLAHNQTSDHCVKSKSIHACTQCAQFLWLNCICLLAESWHAMHRPSSVPSGKLGLLTIPLAQAWSLGCLLAELESRFQVAECPVVKH